MVVIGEVFTEKEKAARTRIKTEMKNLLSDNLSIPVVESSELEQQLKFGFRHSLKLAFTFIFSLAVFLGIFTFQQEVLTFLSAEQYRGMRVLAVLLVVLLTPFFAYNYGSFIRQILKLLRLD